MINVRVFLFLFFFIMITGCVHRQTKRPPQPASPKASSDYQSIQKWLKKKKSKEALPKLQNFVQQHPESDLTDDAYISMGDIYYSHKEYTLAANAYLAVVRSDISSPREPYASYRAALCYKNLGQYSESLGLTDLPLSQANNDEKLKVKALKLKQYLLTQLGDHKDLLKTLLILHQLDTSQTPQNSYLIEAQNLIEQTQDANTLDSYLDLNLPIDLKAQVYYKMANHFYEARDFSRSEKYYEGVVQTYPDSQMAEFSLRKIRQIDTRNRVNPYHIGVILPLDGKHSAIAQRALNSLKLGLGIFGDNPSRFKVAVLSSHSNQDSSQMATERLILEDNVIAIVGSLLSKTATSVAQTSNLLGVPNISLSQKSDLTRMGPYVFRNSITSKMMIKELVHTALHKKNIRKIAILYPNDNYGVEYANLFWDEVLLNGGEIVGAQIYKSGETDFNAQLMRLLGTFYVEDRLNEYKAKLRDWKAKQTRITSRTSPPQDLLPPIKAFDAIFIPDTVKTLGQIAPSLPYHDVSNVVLMGTNLWHTPTLVQRGGKQVENSLFVDGLLQKDAQFVNSDFYRQYKATFNEEPGLLEAQAYDTGLILRTLILNGARNREDLAEKLNSLRDFPAALGQLSMNTQREIERPVYSFTVEKGEFLQLSR